MGGDTPPRPEQFAVATQTAHTDVQPGELPRVGGEIAHNTCCEDEKFKVLNKLKFVTASYFRTVRHPRSYICTLQCLEKSQVLLPLQLCWKSYDALD